MPTPRIRMAKEADGAALLAVYLPYMETTITFEYTAPTQEEFAGRVRDTLRDYPYLLCEEEGRVLGYAYAHRLKSRAAYQWDAELSVYLSREAYGRGIGRALYGALMDLLERQGVRNVYGVITADNERSIRFHRSMGFTDAGVHHKTGFKNGSWLDVVWLEKRLGGEEPPVPVRPIGQLGEETVASLLRPWQEQLEKKNG